MRVLVISDLHCGFAHPQAKNHIAYCKRHFKTNLTVCMGDEMDYHAMAKWPTDPDGDSAGLEHQKGINQLHEILSGFKNIQFLESNHTVRPLKKAFLAGIPKAFLKSYREFLKAPKGWTWHEKLLIDNVGYIHGEPYTGRMAHIKAANDYRQSMVIGHVHSFGGVQYTKTPSGQIFGLNSGCLIDESAYAFRYGKVFPNKPTIGMGVVLEGREAFFIPL